MINDIYCTATRLYVLAETRISEGSDKDAVDRGGRLSTGWLLAFDRADTSGSWKYAGALGPVSQRRNGYRFSRYLPLPSSDMNGFRDETNTVAVFGESGQVWRFGWKRDTSRISRSQLEQNVMPPVFWHACDFNREWLEIDYDERYKNRPDRIFADTNRYVIRPWQGGYCVVDVKLGKIRDDPWINKLLDKCTAYAGGKGVRCRVSSDLATFVGCFSGDSAVSRTEMAGISSESHVEDICVVWQRGRESEARVRLTKDAPAFSSCFFVGGTPYVIGKSGSRVVVFGLFARDLHVLNANVTIRLMSHESRIRDADSKCVLYERISKVGLKLVETEQADHLRVLEWDFRRNSVSEGVVEVSRLFAEVDGTYTPTQLTRVE